MSSFLRRFSRMASSDSTPRRSSRCSTIRSYSGPNRSRRRVRRRFVIAPEMSAAMAITPSAIRMTIRRSMAPSSYRLGLRGRPGGHRLSGSYPGRTEANSGSAVSGPAASFLDGALPGQPGLAAEPGLVLAPALLLGLGQHGRNLSRPTLPVEGHEHQVRAGGVDGPARGDRLRLDPNPDLHRGSAR